MILKNGKRIDGCTDTLPVGTVQPFLGLTPPLGYLVCQGQLISKIEYPELYRICGSTFGAETDTHFYLPDLRGKTIAGYDSNDDAMNTIGKLLGNKTHTHTSAAHTHTIAGHTHTSAAHTHTTGNHTLTVAEIPGHRHSVDTYIGMVTSTDAFALNDSSFDGLVGSDVMADGVNSTPAPSSKTSTIIGITGGSGAHNHGNTGSTIPDNTGSTSLTSDSTTPGATGSNTNFQPTITLNWIVKAAMLIPEYFVVENTLTSTSTNNALSAAQGKILNDSKLSLTGGTLTGNISIATTYPTLILRSNNLLYNTTPSTTEYPCILWTDKNNTAMGRLEMIAANNGSRYMSLYAIMPGDTAIGSFLKVGWDANKNPKSSIDGDFTVGKGATITNNLSVGGSITVGSGFGKKYSFTKTLRLGTDWIDTGISKNDLPQGVYIVYMTGIYQTDMSWQDGNIYTGIMTMYTGVTNSAERFEIPLHRGGHAFNDITISLATFSHANSTNIGITLQIKSSVAFTRDTTVNFTFVKII